MSPASASPELLRRQKALQATFERFGAKPLGLGEGKGDCAKMARFHLGRMGHSKLPKPSGYRSAVGARRELARCCKEVGAEGATLEALFDRLLERIAPARMLPGDLALVESDPEAPASDIGTVVIALGGNTFWGWRQDLSERLLVLRIREVKVAWRA